MVFGITEVNKVATFSENMAKSLRVVKLGFVIVAINKSNLAIAYLVFKCHSVFIDYH